MELAHPSRWRQGQRKRTFISKLAGVVAGARDSEARRREEALHSIHGGTVIWVDGCGSIMLGTRQRKRYIRKGSEVVLDKLNVTDDRSQ